MVKAVLEGFYGRPWSWEERLLVSRFLAGRGFDHYVYAPKDDPRHRERWREPYDAGELGGFERLAADGGLSVAFGISPGLSMRYDDPADRADLLAKVRSVVRCGIATVVLALDDIPPRPGLGEHHAALCRWLREALGDTGLVLVPTEYVGTRPSAYLDALAAGVPADVPIAWTGAAVVNDRITTAQAADRAAALGGRLPLVWDNYPVNDAVMADRLFLGPLTGRDPDLPGATSGWLANAMVQPRASLLALASVGAYLDGGDARSAWEAAVDELGARRLAEVCDGTTNRRLVAAVAAEEDGALDALAAWLDRPEPAVPAAFGEEVRPWVDQARAELDLQRRMARALASDDPSRRTAALLRLMGTWPALRRSPVSVLGVRFGFSPRLGQGPDSGWVVGRDALVSGDNATDALCRLAFDRLAGPPAA